MSRELLIELIERKRALYQQHHKLVIAELDVEIALAECALEKEPELELALRKANGEQLAVKAKLDRSHFFGHRYSRSFVPSLCIACFVDHGTESLMIEVRSDRGNGIRQFECPVCKHVLRINPT